MLNGVYGTRTTCVCPKYATDKAKKEDRGRPHSYDQYLNFTQYAT